MTRQLIRDALIVNGDGRTPPYSATSSSTTIASSRSAR